MLGRLICRRCGGDWDPAAPRWSCDCGGLLELEYSPCFPEKNLSQAPGSLWRYGFALPLDERVLPVSLGEGMTPMVEMNAPGGRRLQIKMDHLQPTGSFKDRGAAVMISRVRALGIREVVEDSSGNAGAAVAAYCARAGVACTVYVPESAPAAKLAQIRGYGARVEKVAGPREAASRAVRRAARTKYYAGHCVDPFFVHGTKTVAYELAEQLGWRAPATVVTPLGNGTLLLGLIRGFSELVAAEWISRMPRIVAFQTRACNPLARSFRTGEVRPAVVDLKPTVADGIAAADPVQGRHILAEMRRVGGEIRDVSEQEIRKAWREWAERGLAVEPTSAVALAGVETMAEDAGDTVVIATGHGLKAAIPG